MNDHSPPERFRIYACPSSVIVDRAAAAPFPKVKSRVPPHLRGLFEAVRDFACGLVCAFQSPEPFTAPEREPWVTLIGDDTFAALGPRRAACASRKPRSRRAPRGAESMVLRVDRHQASLSRTFSTLPQPKLPVRSRLRRPFIDPIPSGTGPVPQLET